MKILEVLTYYRPHVSGLTIYVERMSRALARMGHEVTILTSHAEKHWPREEMMDGVRVKRVPVAFRISKGVIMPTFGHHATLLGWKADVMHLHLPQFDAPGLALRGRIFGKPVVISYHSDLELPPGLFNRVADTVVHSANRMAGSLAHAIVTYTRDFGTHSPYLSTYAGKKLHIIPPPVELTPCTEEHAAAFADQHRLRGRKVIGISARLAAEKGIEVLLRALPKIAAAFPEVLVLHACPPGLGEEAYAAMLEPLIHQSGDHYQRLSTLHGADLTAFYKNLDCLVLCSLNNTETFGLVQIEAMMNGVPCIASDLPGVRQPVTLTGMGEIAPIGDHEALAQKVIQVLRHPENYQADPDVIAQAFSPDENAAAYIRLFEDLRAGHFDPSLPEPPAYQRLRQMREQFEETR